MERTLILAKPDAYARNLTGEILARFERKGLRPVALRVLTMTRELAERHYAEHLEKPFFGELADFITSGPLVAMVLEGPVGDRRGAPGDRRDQPARGGARARSAAISRSRPARTSCTAPTARSRRRARSRSSSPSCGRVDRLGRTRPRVALAAAAGDPDGARRPLRGPPVPASRRLERRRGRREVALANALGKARAVRARAAARPCSASTRWSSWAGGCGASRPTRRRRGRRCGRCPGATHPSSAASRCVGGDRASRDGARPRSTLPRSSTTRRVDWYLRDAASGASAPAATRSRARACALVAAIDGDWTNVVGLPVATLLALVPGLLARHVQRHGSARLIQRELQP